MTRQDPYKHPYYDWECFNNGLYRDSDPDFLMIDEAKEILSNPKLFREKAQEMIIEWPISAENNLIDSGINRKAWMGHATCCFFKGIPDRTTRVAWGKLSESQRNEANQVASELIKEYEIWHKEVHK